MRPLASAAGRTAIDRLERPGTSEGLEATSRRLAEGLTRAAAEAAVTVTVNRVGSMVTVFFCPGPVTDYASAKRADTKRYAAFFHGMLEAGVYFAPSQFEACLLSAAHDDQAIETAIEAARGVMHKLA